MHICPDAQYKPTKSVFSMMFMKGQGALHTVPKGWRRHERVENCVEFSIENISH